jgi:hypothetical protein
MAAGQKVLRGQALVHFEEIKASNTILHIQREQKHGVLSTSKYLCYMSRMLPIQMFLILYIHYSTFLLKILNRLVRRRMERDLSGLKNNYYQISLNPQQQQ